MWTLASGLPSLRTFAHISWEEVRVGGCRSDVIIFSISMSRQLFGCYAFGLLTNSASRDLAAVASRSKLPVINPSIRSLISCGYS